MINFWTVTFVLGMVTFSLGMDVFNIIFFENDYFLGEKPVRWVVFRLIFQLKLLTLNF